MVENIEECHWLSFPQINLYIEDENIYVGISKCCKAYTQPLIKLTLEEAEKVENYYQKIMSTSTMFTKLPCEWDHCGKICFSNKPSEIKEVFLSLDIRCNANCAFCWAKKPREAFGKLDKSIRERIDSLYKRIISDLRNHDIAITVNAIGDSLINKELVKEIISKGGFTNVFLLTNGINLTKDIRDVIDSSNQKVEIQVSVNAWDKKSYKKVMGVDKWDVVYNNIIHSEIDIISVVVCDKLPLRQYKKVLKVFDPKKYKVQFSVDSLHWSKRKQKEVNSLNEKSNVRKLRELSTIL